METNEISTGLQEFKEGAKVLIGGRRFTVESIGDPENHRPHLLMGLRGARYWMHSYMKRPGSDAPTRLYVTSMIGDGSPLRDKAGRRVEAYVFGDLLSSVH